jgi:hypothetical protein
MGHCSSVLSKIEFSVVAGGLGALVAGPEAGIAIGAGAGLVSALTDKKGCDKSKTGLINATNSIISMAITKSITDCATENQALQNVDITCNPNLEGTGLSVYEENQACTQCMNEVFNGFDEQHQMERDAWTKRKSVKVRLSIDDEYKLLIARLSACGIHTCKACSFINLTQVSVINTENSCLDTNLSVQNVQNNIQTLIKQQLSNNQDVLSGVAQALAQKNVDKITETITNRILTQVNNDFLNRTIQNLKTRQVMQFNSGNQTLINNISQSNAFTMISEQVTTAQIAQNTISSEFFETVSQIVKQQNTLDSVGTAIFQSSVTFTSAINSVVTKVLIAVIASLAFVLIMIVSYLIFKFVKSSIKNVKELSSREEQLIQSQGTFEEF